MSNFVYTINVGNPSYASKTVPTIKSYCEKYGFIFKVIDDVYLTDKHPTPHWLKVDVIQDFVNNSTHANDKLLYIDLDIMIQPNARNIFDEYNTTTDGILIVHEDDHQLRERNKNFEMWNTGVMLLNLESAKLFLEIANRSKYIDTGFYEQATFVKWIKSNNIKTRFIDWRYNCNFEAYQSKLYSEQSGVDFMHYAGPTAKNVIDL
jgi:hypothetical protein